MDKSMKFVVLVLLGNLALAISQELEEPIEGDENVRKPGACPESTGEDSVSSVCSGLCENKDSCTTQACTTDFHCEGSLKCCETRCGTECLPPVFRSPCQNDLDCPWTLNCCNGVCDSECISAPKS